MSSIPTDPQLTVSRAEFIGLQHTVKSMKVTIDLTNSSALTRTDKNVEKLQTQYALLNHCVGKLEREIQALYSLSHATAARLRTYEDRAVGRVFCFLHDSAKDLMRRRHHGAGK